MAPRKATPAQAAGLERCRRMVADQIAAFTGLTSVEEAILSGFTASERRLIGSVLARLPSVPPPGIAIEGAAGLGKLSCAPSGHHDQDATAG